MNWIHQLVLLLSLIFVGSTVTVTSSLPPISYQSDATTSIPVETQTTTTTQTVPLYTPEDPGPHISRDTFTIPTTTFSLPTSTPSTTPPQVVIQIDPSLLVQPAPLPTYQDSGPTLVVVAPPVEEVPAVAETPAFPVPTCQLMGTSTYTGDAFVDTAFVNWTTQNADSGSMAGQGVANAIDESAVYQMNPIASGSLEIGIPAENESGTEDFIIEDPGSNYPGPPVATTTIGGQEGIISTEHHSATFTATVQGPGGTGTCQVVVTNP